MGTLALDHDAHAAARLQGEEGGEGLVEFVGHHHAEVFGTARTLLGPRELVGGPALGGVAAGEGLEEPGTQAEAGIGAIPSFAGGTSPVGPGDGVLGHDAAGAEPEGALLGQHEVRGVEVPAEGDSSGIHRGKQLGEGLGCLPWVEAEIGGQEQDGGPNGHGATVVVSPRVYLEGAVALVGGGPLPGLAPAFPRAGPKGGRARGGHDLDLAILLAIPSAEAPQSALGRELLEDLVATEHDAAGGDGHGRVLARPSAPCCFLGYGAGVKLPSPSPERLAPLLGGSVRALGWTWRIRGEPGDEVRAAVAAGPVVFCFWHGEQLPLAWLYRDRGIAGMASLSRDGELLARVIGELGYETVRGSSSRGGAQALRTGIRVVREQGLSVTLAVDGPRGPRHQPHPGAVALSVATGAPMVLVASHCTWALRLGSWDRFVIPGPLARIGVAWGLMPPPSGRSRQAVEQGTEELRGRLLALGQEATGR